MWFSRSLRIKELSHPPILDAIEVIERTVGGIRWPDAQQRISHELIITAEINKNIGYYEKGE